jgi:hypothetical protein
MVNDAGQGLLGAVDEAGYGSRYDGGRKLASAAGSGNDHVGARGGGS